MKGTPLSESKPGGNLPPVHPLGGSARVLLCSVFGPYACDDEYGSRAINPMELYHNQVTRVQGAFSLRMFHRSWGLMLIQNNLNAACNILDFPTRERFIEELQKNAYDIYGISAIGANLEKARVMCKLIRQHCPQATIVLGGHLANRQDLPDLIDADYIVAGEGIRWFRGFLGEDVNRPVKHPYIYSGFGSRTLGVPLPDGPRKTAATLIPSVGCPMGCNFCSTSWMFGGKGKFHHFFATGQELFDVMCDLEEQMKVKDFFVMDENFLFHRQRTLQLLDLMQKHDKSWSLYVFSSAKVILSYTMEQLLGLGISWVWMGLEGEDSEYSKVKGTDTFALVRQLQENGIRVLGSTIIGLENHTPENMEAAIQYAIRHRTEFHQFMLYTPVSGTPLWKEHEAAGTLFTDQEIDPADTHGQYRFRHRHPAIPAGQETGYLIRAFQADFEANGPSIIRVLRTTLRGWLKHRRHPEIRVRRRFEHEARHLAGAWVAGLWATIRWSRRNNPRLTRRLEVVLRQVEHAFGLKAVLTARLLGPFLYYMILRENRRLQNGQTYEPRTFFDIKPRSAEAGKVYPYPARVRDEEAAGQAKNLAKLPVEPCAPALSTITE